MESLYIRGSRLVLAVAFMGMMTMALAACDSGATPTATSGATAVPAATAPPAGGVNDLTPTAASSGGGGAQVKVDLKEWAVVPNPKDIAAGSVSLAVSNVGQFGHDLVIQDSSGTEVGRTPVFKAADSPKTLQVTLKAGTYKFLCDVPGHAAKGMTTDVTVK
jgi:plastocyanin